jgi:UDP-glucose 4-epimerase
VALPVVEPGLTALAAFVRASGVGTFSLDTLDLVVHGRVVDISMLISEYAFTPRSTREAFSQLVAGRARRRVAVPGASRG